MASDDALISVASGPVVPYAKELDIGLGGFANFAFGFSEVSVFSSLVGTLGLVLAAGGAPMAVWGWITASIFTIGVGFSMAEICSAYPSAGSVYHWAGQLPADRASAARWSFVTGWLNFLGNAAGDASFAFSFASLVSASIVASGGDALTVQQQVGVSIGGVFAWSLLNILHIAQVGGLNFFAAVLQFGSLLGIAMAVLFATPKYQSPRAVLTSAGWWNDTGFESDGMVACIGMVAILFGFAGYEASAHMAEETSDAEIHAPKGLIYTCMATAVGGLVFIVPIVFSMDDIQYTLGDASSSTDTPPINTGVAAVQVFVYACGQRGGAVMAWIAVLNLFFAGMSSVAVTSRITFAMARDNGFPFSQYIQGVNDLTKSPVRSVMLCFVFDAVLLMIPLTDDTNGVLAFSSIIGLTVIGFQLSYCIPIFLRVTIARNTFRPSVIRLGCASIPLGIISTLWLFATSVLLFFPGKSPVTSTNMNYVCVVFAVVALIASVYWIVRGHAVFIGPRRSDDVGGSKPTVFALSTAHTTHIGDKVRPRGSSSRRSNACIAHGSLEAGLVLMSGSDNDNEELQPKAQPNDLLQP